MLQHEGLAPSTFAPAPSPREPGAALRLIARVRWFALDGRLAAGEDPSGSTLLAAQAARLTGTRRREQLSSALHGLLLAAEQGPRRSRVTPDRSAVAANEQAMRALARRLDSREALYARGIAHLERLVTDSAGPVFRGGVDELAEELERLDAEMSGRPGRAAPATRLSAGPGSAASRIRFSRPAASPRRLARLRSRHGRVAPLDPPGFAGGSFVLPDGSWFHGRREAS